MGGPTEVTVLKMTVYSIFDTMHKLNEPYYLELQTIWKAPESTPNRSAGNF